jgi:hypothetical protein
VQIKTLIRPIILVVLMFPIIAYGQDRCGTVEYLKKTHPQNDEDVFEQWLNKKIKLRRSASSAAKIQATRRIPVVVHIIHKGEPVGTGTNISDEQVFSQISVLNKDYQRLNDDASNTPSVFEPVASSMDIEFSLARRTPEGLPTNGIVRVEGPDGRDWTSSDDAEFKALSYWDSNKYLNIWVVDIIDYLGYSQFPISDLPGLEGSPDAPLTDGVVINPSVFGSDDYGNFDLDPDYNKGRTTTHEVGHFLGLRHTWGDDGGACISNGGNSDYIDDTPDQANNTVGCPAHPKTSCTGIVYMFQNYMDYTDDVCMNLFTADQVARMNTILENSPRRVSLLSSDGLDDPDPVTTENITIKNINAPVVTCENSVEVRVKIKNNGVDINSYKVKITHNGAVSTATVNNINFDTGFEMDFIIPSFTLDDGVNNLTYEFIEPNGNVDAFPADNVVSFKIVVNKTTDYLPMKQNFNTPFANEWVVSNQLLGMEWTQVETNFGTSLYFNGFGNQLNGDRAWLVSPVFDLTDMEEASMSFDVSYGFRMGTADNLKVFASSDCGQSFDFLLYNETGEFITQAQSNAKWKPIVSDEWEKKSVSLESLLGQENVRIYFVFTNTNGNNIYLDNIEFFTDDDPVAAKGDDVLQIFPNGTPGEPYVRLNLPERDNVRIEVINSMGVEILNEELDDALNQTVNLGLWTAQPGVYFVRVRTHSKSYVEKFVLVR